MKKTIELTPKFTKWAFVFNGIVNTAIGFNALIQSDSWIHWTSMLGIILFVGGLVLFFFGLILFRPSSKLNPRVVIDEKRLVIKEDIFKKTKSIDWSDIMEITYQTFELNFLLHGNNLVTATLPTNGYKSVEIKQTIRNISEKKGIKFIVG
jgi:hypothetical protein